MGVAATSIIHDVAILIAAVAAFQLTPPSVRASLGPVEWVWIVMLIIGSVCGIVGRVFNLVPCNVVGCILMAFGMFTWAVAASTQDMVTASTISVASAFFAGGVAIAYRAFATLVGTFLKLK